MAMLADLERLLERIFERSTARLFRAHLQAVQLDRRVERAMERARSSQGKRIVVPARYRVRLHPDDLADLAGHADGPEALAGRLADAALAFARSHGYHLPGRPSVALVADPSVPPGVVEVDAVAAPSRPVASAPQAPVVTPQDPTPPPVPAGSPSPAPVAAATSMPVPDMPVVGPRVRAPGSPDVPRVSEGAPSPHDPPAQPERAPDAASPDAASPGPASPDAAPAPPVGVFVASPDPPEPMTPGPDAARPGGIRGDGTGTLVFRRPAPAPTRAVLRVVGRDGKERTIEVDGTPLTLGRAPDNGLVVADPRVSRHHARLQARRGTLVLTDLASTNGSRVNGVRVDECALGTGDRVQVGDTVLLVEQLPG